VKGGFFHRIRQQGQGGIAKPGKHRDSSQDQLAVGARFGVNRNSLGHRSILIEATFQGN